MVINKKAIKTAILAALALLVADPLRTIPYAPYQTLLISFVYYPCFLFDRLVYLPFQAAE